MDNIGLKSYKVNYDILNQIYINEIIPNVCNKQRLYLFERNKNQYIYDIIDKLRSGEYYGGNYNIFLVYEPKVRVIMSQNVYHKLVNHYVADYFVKPKVEKFLIEENCATRKGMGQEYAIKLFKRKIEPFKCKYGDDFYFLKIDIKKFFYNIDHEVLKELLKPILDEDELCLLSKIIDSTDKDYINDKIKILQGKTKEDLPLYKMGKGLPIGSVTSQTLAIFYLYKLHYFVKHTLKVTGLCIYMDDLILIHNDKEYLKFCLNTIEKKLNNEYKLELNKKKTMITKASSGVVFLGYRFIIVNNKTIVKLTKDAKRKIEKGFKRNKYLTTLGDTDFNRIFCSTENYLNTYKFCSKKYIIDIYNRYF